jgi:hypothetical protein
VDEIVPREKEFRWSLKGFNFKKYWLENHLPGTHKWIYPNFRK